MHAVAGGGHWQVARHTAEKTKIELHLTAKASRVKLKGLCLPTSAQTHMQEKTLDGFQLVRAASWVLSLYCPSRVVWKKCLAVFPQRKAFLGREGVAGT